MRALAALFAVGVVLAVCATPAAAGEWTELAPMHEARAEPGMTVLDGKLSVFGGRIYTTPNVTHASVEVYDPATDTWTLKAPMPAPRYCPAVGACTSGAYEGMIFVFGGSIGPAKYRNTWRYDPASDSWTTGLADIPGYYKDDGRTAAIAICVDGEMWLIGGYGGSTPQERRVDIYDPVSDTWRAGPWLNYPLQMDGVFEYGGLLYALPTVDRGGVEVCDPHAASPEWTEISVFRHSWPPWAIVGSQVYGILSTNQVVVYDIETNSWHYAEVVPEEYSVGGTLSRTIGGTIYIPGGLAGTLGMDRLLAYTPDWTPPEPPETLPDLIAFQSDRSGNMDIWTMLADGTIVDQITSDPGEDAAPAWSPDGANIAFQSDRDGNFDIFVADPYTGAEHQITRHPADDVSPCWSPEGDRIAFSSNRGATGAGEIWVVDVSDLAAPGTPTKLTSYEPGDRDLEGEISPSWGTNGYVAYSAERGHRWLWSIWATDPDTDDTHEVVGYVGGAGAHDPVWSPDAGHIVYVNMQMGSSGSHNEDIYRAPADGALPNVGEALTCASVIGNTGVYDGNPAWSPSGPNIYFSRRVHGESTADVFVVTTSGGGPVNITDRPDGFDGCPSATRGPAFSDVWPYHWAYDEIEACHRAGIVAGYEDGAYEPDWPVSRDQMAVYISRALASGDQHVPTGPAQASFEDVPAEHWAFKYVEYAVDRGVVAGYDDGLYRPERLLDRGQMAVFIARAVAGGEDAIPPAPSFPTFEDVTEFNQWSWCYEHVEYIASEGIASGYRDDLYHPEYTCSRGQMAVYVARAFGLLS